MGILLLVIAILSLTAVVEICIRVQASVQMNCRQVKSNNRCIETVTLRNIVELFFCFMYNLS